MQELIKTLKIEKNRENPLEYILVVNGISFFKGYGLSKADVEKEVLLEYFHEDFTGGNNKYRKLVDSIKGTNNIIIKGYKKIYNQFARTTKKLYELQKEYRKTYGKSLTLKADYKNYNYMVEKSKVLLEQSETFLKETLYIAL